MALVYGYPKVGKKSNKILLGISEKIDEYSSDILPTETKKYH